MKKQILAVLIGASAFAAVPTMAVENMYVGLWLGQSDIDPDFSDTGASVDDTDTFLSVGGGYEFSENIAIEIGYNDFGEYTIKGAGGKLVAELTSISVAAVGAYPLGGAASIFGKVGFEMWDGEAKTTIGGRSAKGKDDGTDAFFCAGLGYDLTEAATARLEYQIHSFDSGDGLDVDVITLGFTFGF